MDIVADEIETYLGMDELVDNSVYTIVGRNAFVGIWIDADQAFLISRYKGGGKPRVHYEYHWDIKVTSDLPWRCGTAKPISFIEQSKFSVHNFDNETQVAMLLVYLDDIEIKNPVILGVNTLDERKQASVQYQKRLSGISI